MVLKTCFKCHTKKPLVEFYAHPAMSDGRLGKCKKCTKADVTRHREANVEQIREYDRTRHLASEKREQRRRWAKANPHKISAQKKAQRAIALGELTKQPCEACGEAKVDAHHDDYTKPLAVRWLCRRHHRQHHANEAEQQRQQTVSEAA